MFRYTIKIENKQHEKKKVTEGLLWLILTKYIGYMQLLAEQGVKELHCVWLACVCNIFVSGWWRLDSHDLGDRIQARGPSEAASVQRSWHQHQGQGGWRTLSSVCLTLLLNRHIKCNIFCPPIFSCFLGREHLPSLGRVLRQRGHRRAAAERPLWSAGRQHPRRLAPAHRCSGESSGMCNVS